MFENANGSYNYQGLAQPQQKWNNVLTPEQINRLSKSENEFSIGITEEESLRARCNHRTADGMSDALSFDPVTGEARCSICGYRFRPVEPDMSFDEIKEDVYRITDLLQTIKLMYIDFPDNAAAEYFQIIPLIEKIPQLFEYAAKNMARHVNFNWQYSNGNMGAMNMFNNLQQMFALGAMPMPGVQQPVMGQPGGMPMGAVPNNMPVGMAPPQYNQPMMGNAFGYPGAQPVNYQPQTSGFQYTPNQPVQNGASVTASPNATAPAVPANPAPESTTVQQNVTV